MKIFIFFSLLMVSTYAIAAPPSAPKRPDAPDYVELEGLLGKTLYIVDKPSQLWACDDEEAFMDRAFVIETSVYNYCLGGKWQAQVSEGIAQAVDIQLRIREIKKKIARWDEDIKKYRVAHFWYLGADTHFYPDEMRPPRKEKLLVCNNERECEEAKRLWEQANLNE